MASSHALASHATRTCEQYATRSSGAAQAYGAPSSRPLAHAAMEKLQRVGVGLHLAMFDFFGNQAEFQGSNRIVSCICADPRTYAVDLAASQ